LNVHCAGILDVHVAFSELHFCRYWEIAQQTEGHSFGDINEAVIVALSSVTEALCSALFFVFISCVRYGLEQRVFTYNCYMETNTYKSRKRKFRHKFPETTYPSPSGDTISKLAKKVRTDGI
jgi:hypothetical protein